MKNKRIVVAFLVLLMVSALSLPAFARDPTCPECMVGELRSDPTEYSSWRTVYYINCDKNPMYRDAVQERMVIQSRTCTNCRISAVTTSTESRIVCGH